MRSRFLAIAASTLLAACGGAAASTTGGTSDELTIYAAASLKGALDEARSAYEAANPRVTLTISTDSSSALETKVEQGAPADVFLSADTANPQKLIDGGFASGTLVVFAGNELTIIVPRDNPAAIESPADLADDGVDVIAAGETVPITKYAGLLVENLAGQPGYPTDFAARYAANIASREENVASIVGKVELGQGDAGIVYVTDAAASTKVATIDIPPGANVPATYGGVVVKASGQQAAAQWFLAWLAGPGGQAILAAHGFLPPPS
jgi:molybdate transport system substrate-binding protein